MLEAGEHLETHQKKKEFKCNICGKEFYIKWRLQKHISGHDVENTRKCHFYNNGKECPFALIGCKFLHEVSEECSYKKNCIVTMCQFRH